MPVVEFEISVLLQSTFITNIYKSVCPSWVAVGRRRSGMRADAAGEPPPRLSGSLTQTEGQIGALNPHRSWQRFLLNALIFTYRRFERRKKTKTNYRLNLESRRTKPCWRIPRSKNPPPPGGAACRLANVGRTR